MALDNEGAGNASQVVQSRDLVGQTDISASTAPTTRVQGRLGNLVPVAQLRGSSGKVLARSPIDADVAYHVQQDLTWAEQLVRRGPRQRTRHLAVQQLYC